MHAILLSNISVLNFASDLTLASFKYVLAWNNLAVRVCLERFHHAFKALKSQHWICYAIGGFKSIQYN